MIVRALTRRQKRPFPSKPLADSDDNGGASELARAMVCFAMIKRGRSP